ncbi:MAG: protein kinase [Myxococcales bacterium]|nr:protein kinase [Myxococcales bacterium]
MSDESLFDAGPRFEVRRQLGAGGMGVVYEAYDRELQEPVALKVLRDADGIWLARFKQEFRSLHDVTHPNLVTFGEFFDGPSEPFFSMELVAGVDLLTHVRRPDVPGGCDLPRLRAALQQLAVGLAALHDVGKVHRDVKPSNILVTAAGRVVLVDFGLVAEVDAAGQSTGGGIVGTVEYMAPEQALSGDVTPAADWYGLGVVLFEALTGALPHAGRSPYEVIMHKHQVTAPAARALAPDTPADLDALCAALLEIDPAQRPGARAVLDRLGVAPTRARAADSTPPGPTSTVAPPFVGRGAELAELRAAYADVRGQPLVCLVEGVSGVGKSQLVDHFLAGLVADDPAAVVLTGRCYEREVVPFKALDGIADDLARHLAHLPATAVAALLPRRAALLGRLFPVLKRVEAIAASPHVPDVPDPHDQRQRMFAALRELFLRLAERGPLVWYIDDLQWTDADSLVLLADLLTHEDRLPVLIVATVRPVDDPTRVALLARIAQLATTRRLHLHELSLDDARALAAQLLPGCSAATLAAVAADAGGHPMLLHELARHVDTADVRSTSTATLEEMLTRRIARLDRPARDLLEVLAVFGGPLAQDVAALAAELPTAIQVKATTALRVAHLVRTDGIRRSDRVVTYHDRVREHVDAQLGTARRRHLHERLALALEQTGAAEHNPRALVRHARAAGRDALAAAYAQAAAGHAVGALAFDQAAEFFAEAIELGVHDDAALRGLRIELATALMHAGRGPEAAATFVEAARGAEPAVRLDCQRQAAEQWIITGHLQQGMAALRSSLDDIGEPAAGSPRRALVRVLWHRARLRLRGTRHARLLESQVPIETLRRLDVLRAVAHGLAMIDNIRGADFNGRYLLLALKTGEVRRLVGALATEVVFLASQAGAAGRQARRLYAELTELAAVCPDRAYARTWVLLADGAASFFEGRFPAAAAALAQAEEVFAAGPRGLTYEKNNTRVFRVHALRMLGAVQQHGALITELVRTGRQRGDRYLETTLQLLQVQSLLARGDVAEARRNIDEVSWTPPQDGYHLQHWYELRARVELALYEGDAAPALARLAGDFAALRRSMLLRVKLVRVDAAYLRGRLVLGGGAHGPTSAPGRAEVRRIIGQLEGEDVGYATVFALLLRAGLGDGSDDDVVRCLRQAIEVAGAHAMAIQLAAARARLAELVGGDEGAALRAEVARYASDNGIVDPARFLAIAAPELRS